jgi:tRNA U34 5-carboxymethylaminomethyl modifying GTPase MnmE/TrmE
MQQHIGDDRRVNVLPTGIHASFFGSPNVGKSSLFNLLGTLLYKIRTKTQLNALRHMSRVKLDRPRTLSI